MSEEVLQEIYLKIWEKASSFDANVASPIQKQIDYDPAVIRHATFGISVEPAGGRQRACRQVLRFMADCILRLYDVRFITSKASLKSQP